MRKRGAGRPPTYTDSDIAELVDKFRKYIDETDVPIIVEFCYQNEIDKTLIYDKPEFATLRKKCVMKKEAALERGALTGVLEKTTAIFSLKQLGWKDKATKVVFVDPKTLSDKELEELMNDGD